jgi:hypothetical protein
MVAAPPLVVGRPDAAILGAPRICSNLLSLVGALRRATRAELLSGPLV